MLVGHHSSALAKEAALVCDSAAKGITGSCICVHLCSIPCLSVPLHYAFSRIIICFLTHNNYAMSVLYFAKSVLFQAELQATAELF